MNIIPTIICIRNPLLKKGIVQFIDAAIHDPELIYCDQINDIFRYKDYNSVIILIDQKLIPNPCIFCLDKIKNIFPESRLIAITDSKIPDNMVPYFAEIISTEETENEIAAKIYKIYSDTELRKENRNLNNQLSERETEILKFVALGLTNREIAEKLFISAHTVITHRKNITAKLGIKTIAGLTVYAVLNGIISSDEITK
ncbi:MAG: LuxR C-terminal-related transcriptional regulator [Bacteroidales bacterium]|jgi:DNA-binding NarL/FixJ family response regulator